MQIFVWLDTTHTMTTSYCYFNLFSCTYVYVQNTKQVSYYSPSTLKCYSMISENE